MLQLIEQFATGQTMLQMVRRKILQLVEQIATGQTMLQLIEQSCNWSNNVEQCGTM
jgi:hypothetical protein